MVVMKEGSFKIRAWISPPTNLKRLCTIQKPWTYSDIFLYFLKPRFTLTNILNKENRLSTGLFLPKPTCKCSRLLKNIFTTAL